MRSALLLVLIGALVASPAAAQPRVKLPPVEQHDPQEIERLLALIDQGLRGGYHEWALPIAERVVAIRERALGSDAPEVAEALVILARVELANGRGVQASDHAGRALATLLRLSPEKATATATELAGALADHGEHRMARRLLEEHVQRLEAGAADPRQLARALHALGDNLITAGELIDAEAPLARAALLERDPGRALARVLLSEAQLQRKRGDHPRALELAQRAERMIEQDDPALVEARIELMTIHLARRDCDAARKIYLETDAFRGCHTARCRADGWRAMLAMGGCELLPFEIAARHAVKELRDIYGDDHPEVASALTEYALVVGALPGHEEPAREAVDHAIAIYERLLGDRHPDLAGALSAKARIEAQAGRRAETLAAVRRAAAIRDEHMRMLLTAGSEAKKRLYAATLLEDTDDVISFQQKVAPDDAEAAEMAMEVVLRRKGRVLDAMSDTLGALRKRLAPADRKVLDELASVRAELATLVVSGATKASPERRAALVAGLEQRAEALEKQMSALSRGFQELRALPTLEEVRRALPADAALIEIVRHRPRDISPMRMPPGAPRYLAFVARPGAVVAVDLGEADAIDLEVRVLRQNLASADGRPAAAARALYDRILAPLMGAIGDARHLLVAPDGMLNLIPLGVLGEEPALARFEISYLTSGRDVLRLGSRGEPKSGPMIVAAPDFGGAEERSAAARAFDLSQAVFTPLPGTAAEAAAIAEILPGARVLTRGEATEEALKAVAAPRVLHVATHGFFLGGAVIAGEGARRLELTEAAAVDAGDPWLRSGLVLAGAARRDGEGEDGILSALEAASLDLNGTRLVVLSACETGVGEVHEGEGVQGLRRALAMAGAETQVMSLWQVDDEATRDLMIAYYRGLERGLGRSEALRAAKLEMRAGRHSHPYFWAGFILSGDWRPLDVGSTPEGALPPGANGCACEAAPGTSSRWWLFALPLAAAALRRRR